MTTFNLSLFLPYTIDFHHPLSSRRSSHPGTPRPVKSRASYVNAPHVPSLLGNPSPPDSPESVAATERALFTKLDPSSPRLHFATPHNPRSLARTDSHVPEWGRGRVFNQPKSIASQAPPATVLEYAQKDSGKQNTSQPSSMVKSPRPAAPASRSISSEARFSSGAWTVKPALQGNGGLTNAVRAVNDADGEERTWVGTIGFPTDVLDDAKRSNIEDALENDYSSLTVFVKDQDFDGHYNHYCKTILWPVFHYVIPDHPKSKAFEDHSWNYYVKVNQAFADRVVKSYKHGDVIWVHDYHLLLVPKMIRDRLPDARIGFFLHAAFPSSEVFRCLAARRQLLEGMLGANMVAFQCREYAAHFRQSCSRLLVVEVTANGVQLDDRFVDVSDVPIGIVPEQLNEVRKDPEVISWTKSLSDQYAGKFLIVARDKLDNIRGVKQKLLAYEMFLEKYSQYRESVVLMQVATSTPNDHGELSGAIADIVNRINSKYSTLAHQPLVFLKQDIAFPQYLAMLTAADTLMTTSLRDGMNLTCHEFILCQDGSGGDKKYGPLILSEFAGSSTMFEGADLSVNPWDTLQMTKALKHAVEMTPEEREIRYKVLHHIIMHNNGIEWIHELDKRLESAYENQQLRDTMSVPRLSFYHLSERYITSHNRLFLLDYEGTLSTIRTDNASGSPQRMIDSLTDLLTCSENNIIYITSSRTPEELERTFSRVPNLGLVAENGCFVRPFSSENWVNLSSKFIGSDWKDSILQVLNYYKDRIEGSWIEERNCSLVFHYEDVSERDMDSADRQAGDCTNHINDSCQGLRMRAVPGDKRVVIEPTDVSKATAARWILKSVQLNDNDIPDIADLNISDAASSIAESTMWSSAPSRNPSYIGHAHEHASDVHDNQDVAHSSEEPACRRSRRSTVSTIASRRSFSRRRRDADQRDEHHTGPSNNDTSPAVSQGISSPAIAAAIQEDHQAHRSPQLNLGTPASFHAADLQTPIRPTPDFLMVAGDDREDDAVFRWANRLERQYGSGHGVKNVVTVCVGKKNTEAHATLTQGVTGLLTVLQKLAQLDFNV